MKIKNRKNFINYRVRSDLNPNTLEDFLWRNSHILECFGTCERQRLAKRWSFQFGNARRNKNRKLLLKDKYNDNLKKANKERWIVNIKWRNFDIYTGKVW